MTIVEFTGQLCICLYYPGWLETWVMKDCGVKESWTKLLKVARNPVLPLDVRWSKPIYYYAQRGWFLLLLNDKLTLFNPEDGACNQLEVKGVDEVHNVLCHTNNMVKLNGIIHTDKHLMVSPSKATDTRRSSKCDEPGHNVRTCERRKTWWKT